MAGNGARAPHHSVVALCEDALPMASSRAHGSYSIPPDLARCDRMAWTTRAARSEGERHGAACLHRRP